jgi:hypothetical protein
LAKLFFLTFILFTIFGHVWDSPGRLAASVVWVGTGLLLVGKFKDDGTAVVMQ